MPAPSTTDPLALPYNPNIGGGAFPLFMDNIPAATWIGDPTTGALHSDYATISTLGKPNLIQGDRWEQPAGDGLATKVGVGGGFRKFTNDTANAECENTGIGSFPLPTDLRCYMCGVRYADETSRKREGAECEHVMPFWLLFLLIGINHSSYIKWRTKFLTKYDVYLRSQGIHPETFIAYQEWLWGGAYKWSCWPCNRLKNNCGYINIDMDTNFRLSVLNGLPTDNAGLQADPPVGCYTGNVNDHFLALMLSTQSYCRSWRKLYTPQIEEDYPNLRNPAEHEAGGSACRLFEFFIGKFKNGTEELIKKLAIMNMPIAQRRGLTPAAVGSVPDVVGPNRGVQKHETLSSVVDIGNTNPGDRKAPDIEPQQFFSVVTLIARAIILEKTSLTSFAGHFASIITTAFTTLGDTITGTALGAKLGGGGNSNKDSNFINQKGGAIHYSGDGEHARDVVAVKAIDWTRDFMSINLEDPHVIGMPLSDKKGYIVSIIQREIPDAPAENSGVIFIGNSNEQDIWGIHLYKYERVNNYLDEDGNRYPIIYKLYPVSHKEFNSAQKDGVNQYLERAKSAVIGKLAQTENQDEINAIILLSEMPFAEAKLASTPAEQLKMRFQGAAQYVSRALRFAKRAKYTIFLRKRDTEQIVHALSMISSEQDLTDFTTALCLYNLSANKEEDSHKILQFINEFQDHMSPQFDTDVKTIKDLILELVVTMGAGPGGRVGGPIHTEGDTSLIASIIKVNDIVKRVDGVKRRFKFSDDRDDAYLYDKIGDITKECFLSAYRGEVSNVDGSVSGGEQRPVPEGIKSATILYEAVQDSLLSEIKSTLNGIGTPEEALTYILELYKNSCYLEGIYSLLDNMSDETMFSFIQVHNQISNTQIDDAVAKQLERGAVGCRSSIELLLLFRENIQTFSGLYHPGIVELDASRVQRGGGLNITQMIEVLGELIFNIPFLSKDLIDNLALGEGEGDKTKILEFMIMYFNTIYEEMDSMMDWGYVRSAIEQLHQLLSQGVTPDTAAGLLTNLVELGFPPKTAAELLTSLVDLEVPPEQAVGLLTSLVEMGVTPEPATQLLISLIHNGFSADVAAQLMTRLIGAGFPPNTAAELLTNLVNLEVPPEQAAVLLTSLIEKGFNPGAINGVILQILPWFDGNVNLAVEIMTNILQRENVNPSTFLPQRFITQIQQGIHDALSSANPQGGAPKCIPCSTNEVYKPPKKKSIRKKNKKRKTNKKSKKKIIKKSPKYSKRKSIKKKSFKKSKRNTLKKSKRKSKRKNKK